MLGSGNLEKHLILPPCNKTPPSVNGFIKTIYGKLFKMSLEFDRTSPFQRGNRVFNGWSSSSLRSNLPFAVPSSPSSLYILRVGQTEIKTHLRDNIAVLRAVTSAFADFPSFVTDPSQISWKQLTGKRFLSNGDRHVIFSLLQWEQGGLGAPHVGQCYCRFHHILCEI